MLLLRCSSSSSSSSSSSLKLTFTKHTRLRNHFSFLHSSSYAFRHLLWIHQRTLPFHYPSFSTSSTELFSSNDITSPTPQETTLTSKIPPPRLVAYPLPEGTKEVYATVLKNPCLGCGVTFQNTDPNLPGYLSLKRFAERLTKASKRTTKPVSISDEAIFEDDDPSAMSDLDSSPNSPKKKILSSSISAADPLRGRSSNPYQIVCQRCQEIAHANQTSISAPSILPQDLNLLQYNGSVFLHLVDLLDFPSTFFPIAHMLPKNSVHILVFNKLDLFPLSVSLDRLDLWMQTMTENTMKSFKTRMPSSFHAISSKSGAGIKDLFQVVQRFREKNKLKDVVVLGATNVGKSEFLNCLHRMVRYPKQATPHVTSSRIHGTTVAPIPFPLSRFSGLLRLPSNQVDGDLVDTPGVTVPGHVLTTFVSQKALRTWHFSKRLSPRGYKVPEGTSVFLGNLVRIDVVECDGASRRVQLTAWTPPLVPIHVTNIGKATRFCSDGLPEALLPDPGLPPFALAGSFEVTASNGGHAHCTEFVFGGAGFVGISGVFERVKLQIYTVGGSGVAQRPPSLPFEFPKKVERVQGKRKVQREHAS